MMGRVQVPPNPLIDATGHHGTAARISRVLESVMREEDLSPGLYLIIQTARDAAKYLGEALMNTISEDGLMETFIEKFEKANLETRANVIIEMMKLTEEDDTEDADPSPELITSIQLNRLGLAVQEVFDRFGQSFRDRINKLKIKAETDETNLVSEN